MSRPNSIGIVGYGQFGRFVHTLITRFLPACQVSICDPAVSAKVSGLTNLATVARCDVVIVAVPIPVYDEVLAQLSELLDSQAIVVDVATVKSHTQMCMQDRLGSAPYICTHPMFGPTSYEKSDGEVDAFRIVVTSHTLADAVYEQWVATLESIGLSIIVMDAEAHDQYLAETLFLTHFLAQTITVANFVRTNIDTISFGFLMDAVESVREDTALFQDVYKYNPYCEDVIARVATAADQVQQSLRDGS